MASVEKCLGEEIEVGQNYKTLDTKRLRVEKDYLGLAFQEIRIVGLIQNLTNSIKNTFARAKAKRPGLTSESRSDFKSQKTASELLQWSWICGVRMALPKVISVLFSYIFGALKM